MYICLIVSTLPFQAASMRLDAVVGADPAFSSQDPSEVWASPPSAFSPLPPPSCREFVLRVQAPRPAPSSRPTPHKMTTLVHQDSCLVSGVFSQDTMFQ